MEQGGRRIAWSSWIESEHGVEQEVVGLGIASKHGVVQEVVGLGMSLHSTTFFLSLVLPVRCKQAWCGARGGGAWH
eukprot:1136164-Pelagomonas_calceolata.AAC.1